MLDERMEHAHDDDTVSANNVSMNVFNQDVWEIKDARPALRRATTSIISDDCIRLHKASQVLSGLAKPYNVFQGFYEA